MTIKKSSIAYPKTGYFSNLIIDYIEGNEKLKSFYKYTPEIDSFKRTLDDIPKGAVNRELLVRILKDQNTEINIPGSKTSSNIESLINDNTFTVTTGHQLCIFTGPLYFIYKIISTINVCEELKNKFPENNFVPIYWMASEDHDFEEVNKINLFGKTPEWKQEQKGAVGNIGTTSMHEILEELKRLLGDSENGKILVKLFQQSYLEHDNLSDATRFLVNELFGEYGLVILDGNDKDFKKEFASILQDDIFNNSNYNNVNATIDNLVKNGILHADKVQVHPRKINCFYMLDGLRERIEEQDGIYKVLHTELSFSKEELIREIENHPERFSPNVVLRPLYQQKILPNLAYVGGPGEIAYWLELKDMFEHHEINFPILLLRNSALLVEESSMKRLEKMELSIADFLMNSEDLIKLFLQRKFKDEINFTSEEENLKLLYQQISHKVEKIDVTLKSSVEAELQKNLNGIKMLNAKLIKAEKQKQEITIQQIHKIKEKLFPDGSPQDRYDNFIPYYLKYGKSFIQNLKVHLHPLDNSLTILELN